MKNEIALGRYVQFDLQGLRLGKVNKMVGNKITVVLSPYTIRGRFTGQRKRIHRDKIMGIVYRKKVIPVEEARRCRD